MWRVSGSEGRWQGFCKYESAPFGEGGLLATPMGLCYIPPMGTEGVVLDDYFRQYGLIAIFTALAVAVPAGMLIASWMFSLVRIRPRKPDPVKMSIYECGFETLTGTWHRFNFRFYSFALLFVVFDVEVVFLFPWAASFGFLSREFGAFVLIEMALFIAILVVGWLYAWRKGALEWA